MKKILLGTVMLFAVSVASAQTNRFDAGTRDSKTTEAHGVHGVSSSETTSILLASVNHSEFEKYFGSEDVINLISMDGNINIPEDASALGHRLNISTDDEAVAGALSNYFYVGNVSNANGKVSVSLTYFYNHTEEGYKVVMVDMDLVQEGNEYLIVNQNFKGDLL